MLRRGFLGSLAGVVAGFFGLAGTAKPVVYNFRVELSPELESILNELASLDLSRRSIEDLQQLVQSGRFRCYDFGPASGTFRTAIFRPSQELIDFVAAARARHGKRVLAC